MCGDSGDFFSRMVLLGDILDPDGRRDVLDALVCSFKGDIQGSVLRVSAIVSDPRRAWVNSTLETIRIGKLEP